ncbi:MAG: FG-GAP-like repeat-containing protein, partial [Nocardioidaceae bacterium]|nr:FG-GAP-like repeat-containing protein [Nocardioidaceae bacterium]
MSFHPAKAADRSPRSRFVTLCQQLLALAVVIAVLTPAARTVTMDVRPSQPADLAPGQFVLRGAEFPSEVPTEPVEPEIKQYSLTESAAQRGNPGDPIGKGGSADLDATVDQRDDGMLEILSDPAPVSGYGTVGVTWSNKVPVAEDDITLKSRTRENGTWSRWTALEYHDDHDADPNSAEGRASRPGTEPLLVGDVDDVQVKIEVPSAQGLEPEDMKLAVIDPGTAGKSAVQKPAIDTAQGTPEESGSKDLPSSEGDLSMQATTYTPKPKIYSRAQWGANEKIRDKGSLHYGTISGGFVHHTVNANNYSRAQVPGIIRGIYSYHVKTRGWSDIGYNFLVDRFGRIWEGRAGGVARPVVGAHTKGYNDDSFAMSAIGNFDITKPGSAVIKAYAALFAWKLALHGIGAADPSVRISGRRFAAINGHRDAGSTACPGKYLYARIPDIRRLAAKAQSSFNGRIIEGDYAAGRAPDLLVRRQRDGMLFVFVLQKVASGNWKVRTKVNTGRKVRWADKIMRAGDWDRDGHADLIGRNKNSKRLYLMRGKGKARFEGPQLLSSKMSNVSVLAAVGDVTGDGWPDLMGQQPGRGMRIFPGAGLG